MITREELAELKKRFEDNFNCCLEKELIVRLIDEIDYLKDVQEGRYD